MARPGRQASAQAGEQDIEKIAAAQARAADALEARAATDGAIADVLIEAHRRLKLWRLCAKSACRRERECAGDVLGCAARWWPVACSCIEEMPAMRRQGYAAAEAIEEQLKEWWDDGRVLRRARVRLYMWLDGKAAFERASPDVRRRIYADARDRRARARARAEAV